MAALKIVVTVPAATENLDEADALFDEPPRHKTLPSKCGCFRIVQPVHVECVTRFLCQINHTRNFHLHPIRQFVTFHPCRKFVVLSAHCFEMCLVQKRKFIQGASLVCAGLKGLRSQIQQWRSFGSQASSLEICGQEAIAPVRCAALGSGQFGHDYITWQILIFAAQAISDP